MLNVNEIATANKLLIESIKNHDKSGFEEAVRQGAEFEPEKAVYTFSDHQHGNYYWNIIEVAALLGCTLETFQKLKEKRAIVLNEDQCYDYQISNVDGITRSLVYDPIAAAGQTFYNCEHFLEVIFSLLEIGAKPRNFHSIESGDIITADALIRAGCSLEQLKLAVAKYKVELDDTTMILSIKTGWLFKSSERFKFIQSNLQISNKRLNQIIFDLIKHIPSTKPSLDAKKIDFDFLLSHGFKLESHLKDSILCEYLISCCKDTEEIFPNEKAIASLTSLIKAGAEVNLRDFQYFFEKLNFDEKSEQKLLYLNNRAVAKKK